MQKTQYKRYRVSVPITKELDDKLEILAKELSVSKSSLCAMLVSQGVLQKQRELEFLAVNNLNVVAKNMIEKENEKNGKK